MLSKNLLLAFWGLLFLLLRGHSQYDDAIYRNYRIINPSDSMKLFLNVQSMSFLNNNEHFNRIVSGYTLIGFHLTPELVYNPTGKLRIRAGSHFLKYHGRDELTSIIPLFSLEYMFNPSISMVFGSLYGTSNHGLIEPLFNFERVFVNYQESGLQFIVKKGRYWSDAWLNWEKFIFKGDPFQEEFTAGYSGLISLFPESARTMIYLPIQGLVNHRGGQIDVSSESVFSATNASAGILVRNYFGTGQVNYVDLNFNYLTYKELGSSSVSTFSRGKAFYSNLILKSKSFSAGMGFWYGDRFVTLKGHPIYQSVSVIYPGYAEDIRKLITTRLMYNRSFGNEMKIGLRFEMFYDMINQRFENSFGFHILYDQRFFLKKISPLI